MTLSCSMERFFTFTAWLGAVVESAVWYAVPRSGELDDRSRGCVERLTGRGAPARGCAGC